MSLQADHRELLICLAMPAFSMLSDLESGQKSINHRANIIENLLSFFILEFVGTHFMQTKEQGFERDEHTDESIGSRSHWRFRAGGSAAVVGAGPYGHSFCKKCGQAGAGVGSSPQNAR
jgi:hypothetical protein